MIKVSVIVPVYNAGLYLKQCLDSLINQTLKDIEIICINDNSTDNSVKIIKEYKEKDFRIKLINNDSNLGAAASRNVGIQIAKGKYLSILDADDYFEPILLEHMYELCEKYNADLGIYDHERFDDSSRATFKSSLSLPLSRVFNKDVVNLKENSDYSFFSFSGIHWDKMFNKEFIYKYKIYFQNLKNMNDFFFSQMALLMADKIVYAHKLGVMLHYRKNIPNQISSHIHDHGKCVWEVFMEMKVFLEKQGVFNKYSKSFYSDFMWKLLNTLNEIEKIDQKYLYEFVRENGLNQLGMDDCREQNFLSVFLFNQYKYIKENSYKDSNMDQLFSLKFWDSQKSRELFQYLQYNEYKCALWGIGKLGKMFLNSYDYNEFKLEGVIDINPVRQNKEIGHYYVQDFKEIESKINAVMITNSAYGRDIVDYLKNNSKHPIKLIDLEAYCVLGMKIEDCIF